MEQDYSLLKLLKGLAKWKKTILYTTGAAFVLSIVLALLLPVYYQAHTIFYPANESLASPAPLGSKEDKVYIYGSNNDRDRLLSVLKSSEVKNHLIEQFNLFEHYDIDPDNAKAKHLINLKLGKLYKVLKTEYGAIELMVEDTDPQQAADMANSARNRGDQIVQNMVKRAQKKQLDNYKDKIKDREELIRITDDTLQAMRENFEIFDTKTQAGIYAKLLTVTSAHINELNGKLNSNTPAPRDSIRKWKSYLGGAVAKKETLLEDLRNFNKGFADVKQVELELNRYTDQVTFDKEKYNQLFAAYSAPFPTMHVIEEATPPVIKSRPKRSLVVLGSTLLALVLLVLGLIILENYRRIPWQEVFKDA